MKDEQASLLKDGSQSDVLPAAPSVRPLTMHEEKIAEG
jgi:hypothetical protein